MAESMGDVLMYLVQEPGTPPVAAESTSEVGGPYEKLMQGFRPGHYFEVQDFNFGVELADDEGGRMEEGGDTRSYARWRGLRSNEHRPNPPFRPEPHDVSITRQIDASSPFLLSCCLQTKRFHRAVLVKRARRSNAGRMMAVLRMEFENVWLRDVAWEDGDAVKETIKFKYSAVKVTYLDRKPDGSTGSEWPCEWRGVPNG